MKNQGEKKKQENANIKIEFRKIITYITDLTGLFIFSGVNNNRKSRHQK